MALIEGVSKVVQAKARESGVNSIAKVKLVVGELTNALPEALQLAFMVLKETETIFNSQTVLEIEERTAVGQCSDCGQGFEITEGVGFSCPQCSSLDISILFGRELYVEYFEGE